MSGTPEDPTPAVARSGPGHYAVVALGFGGAAVLGLLAQALIAATFGAASETDALFMARDIAQSGTKLLLAAQAAGVLVPLVLSWRMTDAAAAWRSAGAVFTTAMAAALPVVALFVLLADMLVAAFAP